METASPHHARHQGRPEHIVCQSDGICIDPTGIVGEWIHVGKNKTYISPLKRIGGGNCGHDLVKTPHLYHGTPSQPTTLGAKCPCFKFEDEYEWTSPSLPTLFSPSKTCERLGNQTVLFIGDSTSQQAASTLMNALVRGNCQTQVFSAMSDDLIGCHYGMGRGKRWGKWVEEVDADIVILSVGAHIAKYLDHIYLDLIDKVLHEMEAMQQVKPNLKFVFKTQTPGGCTKDIISPHNATDAFERSVDNHRFNYGRMRGRDLLLISRLQELGVPYLDMRMLYSRSDAKVSSHLDSNRQTDCQHMCIPGPLEVIARLFDEVLLQLNNNYKPLSFDTEYLSWIPPKEVVC